MSHLSDVFKYISHFRHAGHQVGRKVGDMLEILTYAAIARDQELYSRLHVEPKLHGFTAAGHKVEFVFHTGQQMNIEGKPLVRTGGEITDPSSLFAFVECKKVGVEQTVNNKFKSTYLKHDNKSYEVPYNTPISISFSPSAGNKHSYEARIGDDKKITITKKEDPDFFFEENLAAGYRLIFTLSSTGTSEVLGNTQSLRDVPYTLKNCRILEIIDFKTDKVIALLNDCLPGPQTPEKAKQSSFVALDVRKKRFNSFDKRGNEKELISVLVLTEFSHWEGKSQNMIKSCIDKNFVVSDSLIIEAFEKFEHTFGFGFYKKITKDSFSTDKDVIRVLGEIINKHEGKIFLDLDDEKMKRFAYSEGSLTFED